MASVFSLFPGKERLLKKPLKITENIEIIREFNGAAITTGLFDFDGTLSDERVGWPNLMVASNTAFLVALSNPSIPHKTAEKMVIEDIEKTIGIPTYMQMKRLRTMIEEHGYNGPELDPRMFKDVYNDALVSMVESRREKLKNGQITIDNLRIQGSLQLLEKLSKILKNGLYLASGSDVDAVRESVERLGFTNYFPEGRITGAGSLGPEDDAKEAIIKRLIDEQGVKGNELITFGDGFPEILHTYLAGGVAVGVLTYDHSYYERLGHFSLKQKEQRLINAGAHILVRNPFNDVELLIETISKGYSA